MALSKVALPLKLAGGLETKMDAKSVPGVKLLGLENAVFTRAISLVKRNGYAALSRAIVDSGDLVTDAVRLGRRDDELLAFTRERCFSHLKDADQWLDAGPCFSVRGTDRVAIRTGTEQLMGDHASLHGVTVYAWEDSRGGVWWSVVDAASGRIDRAPAQLHPDGISPRCLAVGQALHIYYAVPALGHVYAVVVNPDAPSSATGSLLLIDDLSTTNPVFDACSTTRYVGASAIAWAERSSENFRVGMVHASGVLGSPATALPSPATAAGGLEDGSGIAVAYVDDNVTVVAQNSGTPDVVAWIFDDTFDVLAISSDIAVGTTVGNPARIAAAFDGAAEPTLWVAYEQGAAEPSERWCQVASTPLFGPPSPTREIRGVGLASRAFRAELDGDVFAVFVHDTTYFNTYVTLRLSDFAPVGRHLPGLAAGAPARRHLPSAHIDGDVASICLPYRERLLSENADQFTETGLRLVSLDFASDDSHQTAQLGRGLYMAGACPLHYDGHAWTEQGFHFGPELIVATPGAGGSLDDDNTYLYRAWYEWTDAQGEIHRGPTSFGTLVTLTAGQTQVTLELPTLRVTRKDNVRICVARSTTTYGETQLYRVSSSDPQTSGQPNGYVANDPTVDRVTFIDRMGDAHATTQEPLYTNGGILSTDPSALGSAVAGGKSRLFFADPSDGNLIRYSQTLDPGYGVECPPELVVQVDPFGGPVTGLAVMDDTVIAFKASAIFAFAGGGPLPNGDTSQGGFSEPQLITSDVGCSAPSSIALTPAGLVFQSAKGIYLLDRGRSVQYVGAPVEAFNAQAVRRATVMPDRTQVVFLTDSGKTLLYDYLFGQWSTFSNHEGKDGIIVGDTYHYLRRDDRVFRETVGVYSDAGSRIPIRIETAWIHMQDYLQGFQRFYELLLIGERKSAHQLKLQWRLDYSNQWSDPWYLDATGIASQAGWISGDSAPWIGDSDDSLVGTFYGDGPYGEGVYGGVGPGLYQWRLHLGYRGQAVQFAFEDYEADGFAGASFELSEMTIVAGVKGPANKPFAAAKSA
ncbi:MAG: hypothetical protein ACTHU0_19140 [Kofleriaceae bacterium]